MEPLWYFLGFVLSALLGAQLRQPFALPKREKEPGERAARDRLKKQWENLLAYDGNEQGEEEIDE